MEKRHIIPWNIRLIMSSLFVTNVQAAEPVPRSSQAALSLSEKAELAIAESMQTGTPSTMVANSTHAADLMFAVSMLSGNSAGQYVVLPRVVNKTKSSLLMYGCSNGSILRNSAMVRQLHRRISRLRPP